MDAVVDIVGPAGYLPSYWIVFACFAYILFYALAGSKPAGRGAKTV